MLLTQDYCHSGWSVMLEPGQQLAQGKTFTKLVCTAGAAWHGTVADCICVESAPAIARVAQGSRGMQVSVVALQGRVLTPAQLSEGWYLLPANAQLAKALAQQGAAWLPSVAHPALLQEGGPLGES